MQITVDTIERPRGARNAGRKPITNTKNFKRRENMPHPQMRALFALYGTLEGALSLLGALELEGELYLKYDGSKFTGGGSFITYDKAHEHTAKDLVAEMIETIHVIATGFSNGTATVEINSSQTFKS
jgi:hypothetical protein